MNRQVLAVAWYRLGATFGRQRNGYLAIVLLVGLVGRLAMGSVAAARRTQSSFPELVARTNSSDLGGAVSIYNPSIGFDAGYYPALLRTIAHLPHVKHLESEVGLDLLPLGANGLPIPAANWYAEGSVNGLQFDQDTLLVAHGRLPNPRRPNEFVMDSATAKLWRMHLGEVVTFGIYTNAQAVGSPSGLRPRSRVTAKLVGVGTTSAEELVVDQFDADAGEASTVLFTPALTKSLLKCCADNTSVGLQLDGGSRYDAAVTAEIARVVPKGVPFSAGLASVTVARVERAVRPESIAVAVFGGIAAVAALVIGGQVIGRRLRLSGDELVVMRALGAGPAMTMLDGLIGTLGAVLAGSLPAAVVAVILSPLGPLGPIRPYLPVTVAFDWTVIGVGFAVLVMALTGVALVVAYRGAPQRSSARRQLEGNRPSWVAQAAGSAGLSAPAVAGIRFALEPGTGANAVPVRSAILGTVLAVITVIATITFGASLNTLVSHPSLYGWNWDYALFANGGDIPAQAEPLVEKDPVVSAWEGVYFGHLQIDGLDVPVMGAGPGSTIGPSLLSGHGLDHEDQVVLGALTLSQLGKRVGDTVEVRSPGTVPTRLRIVGTATMPAFGGASGQHMEMGSGALVDYRLIPPGQRNLFDQPDPGPNAILLRTRPGTSTASADRSIVAIIIRLGGHPGNSVPLLGPQRPAEIISYQNLGATPALLGGALAAGAVTALGLTLVASVRRRRRDLALLKTLGFTKGQLAATVSWQSTVAVAIGTVGGVPLGIALGRSLWDLFAREIDAAARPSVPVLSVVVIGIGALVLANLVAAIPGRIAARTPTALAFRTE
jgi:hypothetical protein